jgi:thiamine biosynthesis protein ThiS
MGKAALHEFHMKDAVLSTNQPVVIANGKKVPAAVPCTLEEFLLAQHLFPRSVVVEHNGEAVAPSEFAGRLVKANDRLEIVKIVAGG